MPEISVVIPAFNESATIGEVVKALKHLPAIRCEIIVVDDGSTDATASEAEKAGADRVICMRRNRGYGAALKTGVAHCSHDLIATIDADLEHEPRDIIKLLEAMDDETDMVSGNRANSKSFITRGPGKWLLRQVAEFLSREKIPDLNCGLRLFRKDRFLTVCNLLPDGYSFSTNLTLAFLKNNFNVKFVPVTYTLRREGKSKVSLLRDGINTLGLIMRLITIYDPMRVFMPASIILFIIGLIYAVVMIIKNFNIPDGAVLLMVTGVFLFFFGLLAEQIAELRRQLKSK
ncbi:MAG: glycosyltransferase family 2 protein [Candidatus Sumerlaeia bacterium]|nr:glycosyltransferase family 2 protein [Candidatus Sumerlaeia bacterium]